MHFDREVRDFDRRHDADGLIGTSVSHGIRNQVPQRLRQSVAIAAALARSGQVNLQPNRGISGPELDNRSGNAVVQIEGPRVDADAGAHPSLGEIEEIPDEGGGSPDGAVDALDGLHVLLAA